MNEYVLYREPGPTNSLYDFDLLGTYDNLETASIAMSHFRSLDPSSVYVIDEDIIDRDENEIAWKTARTFRFDPADCCG